MSGRAGAEEVMSIDTRFTQDIAQGGRDAPVGHLNEIQASLLLQHLRVERDATVAVGCVADDGRRRPYVAQGLCYSASTMSVHRAAHCRGRHAPVAF